MKRAVAVFVWRSCYWISIGLALSASLNVMLDGSLVYGQLGLIALVAIIGRGTFYFLGGI